MIRKVFSYFQKKKFVKKLVVLAAIVTIVVVGTIISVNQFSNTEKKDDGNSNETNSSDLESPEVQEKLDEIEKIKSENEYTPKPREWITSGPFQIDRSEYVLGEKIFLRIGGLNTIERGEVIFHAPVKSVDNSIYIKVPFNGEDKPAFNYYIEPQLSKTRGFCTADDFIGEWIVTFYGTSYDPIKFKITDEVLPGGGEDYQSIC